METAAENTGTVLRSERIAGGILPKVLNSFDMVAIFVAIVLFISNSSVVTGAGAAAFIYWLLGFLTFLIPGAIVTGQLGLMFPGEGSIYVWTTRAFGAFMGFFAGFCAWWPGVLVMIATGDAVVSLIQQLGSQYGLNLLADPWQQGLVILLVIALSCMLSVLRFRVTQNLVNIIFVAYGGAILLVGLAGLTWLLSGHPAQADFSPARWQLNSTNYTFYGLVILALLGIEVPLNMGVEIQNTRAITRYLLWGSVVVMVAYLLGTFGVMMAVPPSIQNQGNPSVVAAVVKYGFGPAGNVLATIVNLIFIGFFLFNTVVYNYSFGRLLFVSGLDRRLPTFMSKVNRNRVPWVAVLVQSIISGLLTAITFIIAPLVIQVLKPSDLSTVVYDVLQAAVTIIWCISMVFLFIDVIYIRYKYRESFRRVQLAPDWVFYLCAVIGCIASAFGVVVIFISPWTTLISTLAWDLSLIGFAAISLVAGAVIYVIGQATIRRDVSDEEILAEVVGAPEGMRPASDSAGGSNSSA
ncbi:APC family permease [Thermogemmatispora sp.]|uniref:APC family permease n=1 Tax=Thermogemmatispora sp. TaxID=1968838 RepID=UPI002ACC0176|nr:APC family permease [Thermogemmatispora sp.]